MIKLQNFSQEEFNDIMRRIEFLLKKATELGGFKHLSSEEKNLLEELSIVAEQFEDNTPLFPIL